MIIILDNLVNNYLNILSCLIMLSLIDLNIYKYFIILVLDILLNGLPIISLIILCLYFFNMLLFRKLNKNNKTLFIVSVINLFIFISIIYIVSNYNFNFMYYLKNNVISILFNIVIYYIYIFYK